MFALALAFALALGQPAPALQPPPGLLVERRLARELDLAVGDTLRARALAGGPESRAFRVEGVFERPADPNRISRNELEVRFHLPDLEAMLPVPDRVDRFALVLREDADPRAAAAWVERLAFGTSVHGTEALAAEASTTFAVVSRFHRAIGIVTVLASGIFLLCVMVIRVDERRREIGVMRLIGISRRTIYRTVVLEAAAIAALGSAAGLALGWAIAGVVNRYYAAVYDTTLRFALVTPGTLGVAAALGLLLGLAAGVLAALRVVRIPVERLGER
jgi:putative ABC transport system permease protein